MLRCLSFFQLPPNQITSMSCKNGLNWGEKETKIFLELCIERKILTIMDGKKHKHIDILSSLVPAMLETGYSKSAEQMKLKLKSLRLAYMKCKRSNSVSGASPKHCQFFDDLDLLYGCRPSMEAVSSCNGIDTAAVIENGMKSYQTKLESYSSKLLETQQNMMETLIDRQDRMQKAMLDDAMSKQREWEERGMERERAFQREQMTMMMQTFAQTLQSMRPQVGSFPSTGLNKFIPLRVMPMNHVTSATVTSENAATTGKNNSNGKENDPKTK